MKEEQNSLAHSCWKKTPAIAFLGSWVLFNLAVASVLESGQSKGAGGIPIPTLVVAVIFCMVPHQTHWKVWKRIGYVFLSWLGVSILGILFMLFLMGPLMALGLINHIDAVGNIVAGIPVLLIAMKQSHFFINIDKPNLIGV